MIDLFCVLYNFILLDRKTCICVFVGAQPQFVLQMFLFLTRFQPQCSYKIVLIKKKSVFNYCKHFGWCHLIFVFSDVFPYPLKYLRLMILGAIMVSDFEANMRKGEERSL